MSHFKVTAILRDFSRSNNNSKWELSDNTQDEKFLFYFKPMFHADGNCKDNNGYVSIIFHGDSVLHIASENSYEDMEFRCYVSVVDVTGNKKFTQSVVYLLDKTTPHDLKNGIKFGLERYLKRETLLNDSAELLPDDCLTICVEIDYISSMKLSFLIPDLVSSPPDFGKIDERFIDLDSNKGKDLCRMSDYFRRASDIPMIEGRTRKVRIPKEERRAFESIFLIIRKTDELKFYSIADICDLYRIADKYDIQLVIDTCRQLLKSFLCKTDDLEILQHTIESVPEILELAEKYEDADLKDTMETYQEINLILGADDYALGEYLKDRLYTEWICQSKNILSTSFILRKTTRPKFQFYQ